MTKYYTLDQEEQEIWAPVPGGVLRDPSDGDVRRIFLGSKFSIPGFFWVGEFGRYFFGGT